MDGKIIRLDDYSELAHSLTEDGEVSKAGTPETLCATADVLLAECGVSSTLNSLPAFVTPWASEVQLGNQRFYAKIARLKKSGSDNRLPLIVFDDDPDTEVTTPNLLALGFKEIGPDICLVVQNELDPDINDIRYLGLVKTILEDIAAQYETDVMNKERAKAARGSTVKRVLQAIGEYFTDEERTSSDSLFYSVGGRRIAAAGALVVGSVMGYGHLLFTNADAKIGPFPLPQPIELIVDLNNKPDHIAQGFSKPQDARVLTIGEEGVEIPLLADYDTTGVPSSSYYDENGHYQGEESGPGLYRVDFKYDPSQKDEKDTEIGQDKVKPANRSCVTVHGRYGGEHSRIFTQDTDIQDSTKITELNNKDLAVCVAEGVDAPVEGSFFVWRDK